MMLLPSALSCEALQPTQKPTRPKLASMPHYMSTRWKQSPLQSSCRALQVILATSAQLQCGLIPGRTPLQPRQPNARTTKSLLPDAQTTCGKNKRRWRDVEQENESDIDMSSALYPETHSTPKRQRRVPLAMPLGLTYKDFASLEDQQSPIELDMPRISKDVEDINDWTTDDDRILVETVLEKLRLSKTPWNECATILGKDRDSLGRRWQLLVREGRVGLRRGRRIEGTDLDIRSW